MQPLLAPDGDLAALAQLDAVDIGLEGQPTPNWRFIDEVVYVAAARRWTFRDAVWGVLASRARQAGLRDALDIDALTEAVARLLPWSMRLTPTPTPPG